MTLFEKADYLGGQINIASVPPRKNEILRSVEYYQKVLPTLNVDIHFNEEAKDINSYDYAIIAVGAHNMEMPIPHDNGNIVSSWDVLNGQEVTGDCVVIGGGLVGAETAEYLANKGHQVTIIEMMDQIAKEESNTILPTLMRQLELYNVQIVTSAKLSEIKDDSVVVDFFLDDNTSTEEIASDFVVMADGARKNLPELSDCPLPLHYIGDCAGERPSNIEHAIKSAYDVACEI